MQAPTTESMPPTEMIYYTYEGCFELEYDAKIVGLDKMNTTGESKKEQAVTVDVFLDRTVMHAQGGGQPTDIGVIKCQMNDSSNNKEVVIAVDKVTINREYGVATHRGTLSCNDNDDEDLLVCLAVGTPVRVSVDAETRGILSECHTAGHVVDAAMYKCGKAMRPTKGYHFLEGPYVEYEGNIPAEERAQFLQELQAAFQELVDADIPTAIEILPEDQANEVCNRIANNFDMKDFGGGKDEPSDIRVVTVANFSCPCGGTHVKSTGDLKERKWGVVGIKNKKGVVRVRYGQDAAAST